MNQNSAKEVITLTRYQSREHSLFYAYVWNNSNRDLFGQYVSGTDIKNIMFLRNELGVLEVYYDLDALDQIFANITSTLEEKSGLLEKIIDDFYQYWDELLPYVEGDDDIESIDELKTFYENWTQWWAPMAYIFVLPDQENLSDAYRKQALKVREETQEYSDDIDRVFVNFIEENHPEYADIASLLTPDEVFSIPESSVSDLQSQANKREDGVALVTVDGESRMVLPSELDSVLDGAGIEIARTDADEVGDTLEGEAASSGRAAGPVRLVLKKDDLSSVKQGDIMVAYATSPDYVPAMKKCAAIVTDEGGITSHAAIVSRELDLPCVVGSEVATQVLNNGDKVEVDADEGVVKMIEENQN